MRVLLYSPPYVPGYMRNARWLAKTISGSNWYPIWLAYCTGLLEKHGHEVKLVDAIAQGMKTEELVAIARDFAPQLCVEYAATEILENDDRVARQVQEATGAATVFVGPWCSMEPEYTLANSSAQALAVGEFDYTVLDMAEVKALSDIPGLCWKKDGQVVRNPSREPVSSEQLDEFPFVTEVYSRHLNLRDYHQASLLYPFIDLFTGRGCPWGRCTFCVWPFTIGAGAPYRKRSMKGVIEELRFVKEELPAVREVYIQDDTLSAERAAELSQAIIDAGLRITWSCYARANMEPETLNLMRRAGCRSLQVGYESSDQGILQDIHKGVTVRAMEEFTRNAQRLGFIIQGDFIFGLPGETQETILRTIRWAKAQPIQGYQFTTPKPYPGTPFFGWLAERGYLRDGRVSYEDLTGEEIDYWVARAIRECHFHPAYLWRMLKLVLRRPEEARSLLYAARHVIPSVVLPKAKAEQVRCG